MGYHHCLAGDPSQVENTPTSRLFVAHVKALTGYNTQKPASVSLVSCVAAVVGKDRADWGSKGLARQAGYSASQHVTACCSGTRFLSFYTQVFCSVSGTKLPGIVLGNGEIGAVGPPLLDFHWEVCMFSVKCYPTSPTE